MASRGTYRPPKDLKTKVEILREVENGVLSKTEIAKKYDITKSTLSTYIKNKESIIAGYEKQQMKPSRKRLRTSAHPQLEDALVMWIKQVRSQNLPLSGPIIAAKAREFATKMALEEFSASDGWLSRFKERHGLTFKTVCGEKADVDRAKCEEWLSGDLKDLLAAYSLDDVFNADETALYYKLLPSKTITFQGDDCAGGKKSKERLTVMVCANATGTERCRLLVIGKAAKPRCFKGVKTLPVDYVANKKAWMTMNIFSDWVRVLDRKFAAKGRKILLFVDNCTSHCNIEGLRAIRLAFLPKNTTALLQPMDMGVIQNLKTLYRRHILERMLLCLNSEKTYSIDLLGAAHILTNAWNSIKQETIANCFRKCGFVETVANAVANGDEEAMQISSDDFVSVPDNFRSVLPDGVTFESYVQVDSSVHTSGVITDAEIIESACPQVATSEDPSALSGDDSDDSSEVPLPPPSDTEALSALDVAARYFSCQENAEAEVEMICKLRAKVIDSLQGKRVQTRITDYFS